MATRRELRYKISQVLSEPFIRDYPSGATTKQSMPNPLWDKEDRWKNGWVYWRDGVNANVERRIVSYTKATGAFVTNPTTASWGNTDNFELHAIISATAKNNAINTAILEGWPSFPDIVELDIEIPEPVSNVYPLKLVAGSGEDFAEGYYDIFKAWYIPESANAQVEIFDILPILSPTVTEILIPNWLAHQTGATLRVQAWKPYATLALDTDSTSMNEQFIVYRALEEIYTLKASEGAGRERGEMIDLSNMYANKAQDLKIRQGRKQPAKARWQYQGSVADFRRRRNPLAD